MTIVSVFDCEATGLLKPTTKIIEFAVKTYKLETEELESSHVWRFNPERSIEAQAQAIHKITIEDLKGKPTIKKFLPDIAAVFKRSDYIVGHNIESYDIPLLKQEFQAAGIDFPDVNPFDTMVNGTFATDLGKSPTLGELAWALDVDYDPDQAHSALYDIEVNAECFFTGVRRGWFEL